MMNLTGDGIFVGIYVNISITLNINKERMNRMNQNVNPTAQADVVRQGIHKRVCKRNCCNAYEDSLSGSFFNRGGRSRR